MYSYYYIIIAIMLLWFSYLPCSCICILWFLYNTRYLQSKILRVLSIFVFVFLYLFVFLTFVCMLLAKYWLSDCLTDGLTKYNDVHPCLQVECQWEPDKCSHHSSQVWEVWSDLSAGYLWLWWQAQQLRTTKEVPFIKGCSVWRPRSAQLLR